MRSTSCTRIGSVVLGVMLLALACTGAARADGDPASDVLYNDPVFYPYNSISKSAQDALTTTVGRAKRAGYPIRVALIASPDALGAVTALWAKPHQYARFLDLELSIAYKGPLLIVMPQGVGFAHYKRKTAAEDRALSGVQVMGGKDGLAKTAITAVSVLSRRAGHPIVAVQPQAESSSSKTLWAAVLAGVFVIVAATVMLRHRRAAPQRDSRSSPHE
jgi:hypothetical protein